MAGSRRSLLCRLLLSLTCLVLCTQNRLFAMASIATTYSTTLAGQLVMAPGSPYVAKTIFDPTYNTISLIVSATYPFDGDSNTFPSQSANNIPNKVVIPWPYCAPSSYNISSVTPSSCAGGLLLYGHDTIPSDPNLFLFGIPDSSSQINGATDTNIQGKKISNIDQGGSLSQYKGTITWIPPSTCPLQDSSFSLTLTIGSMTDTVDDTPIEYVDSASNVSLWADVYGLKCSLYPRPQTSPAFDPRPWIITMCRNFLSSSTPSLDSTLVHQMFGSTSYQGLNLAAGSVVYQLRLDNLDTNLLVQAYVKFQYADNTLEVFSPLYVGFDRIVHVHSSGKTPAFVYVCWYKDQCNPIKTFNEVDLWYLPPCNCDPGNGNIRCNSTNSLIDVSSRASMPNYNIAVAGQDIPVCRIFPNVVNNGSKPIAGVPFTVTTGSYDPNGQDSSLTYAWQLSQMPLSAGLIQGSTTGSSITVLLNAQGTYTISHAVGLGGVWSTCTETITVDTGRPTACFNPFDPVKLRLTVTAGTPLVLDASCSSSPIGPIDSYQWQVTEFIPFDSPPHPTPTSPFLSSTTLPVITFQANQPELFLLTLVVRNAKGLDSISSIISVKAAATSPSPSSPSPLPPPGTCTCSPSTGNTAPPFSIAIPPKSPPPPITIIQNQPAIELPPLIAAQQGPISALIDGPASRLPVDMMDMIFFGVFAIVSVFVVVGCCIGVNKNGYFSTSRGGGNHSHHA